MITIHKYELDLLAFVPYANIRENAKFLKCANQNEKLYLWYEVNTHEVTVRKQFVLVTTGAPIPQDLYPRMEFIETVLFSGGNYVIHVYSLN